MKITEVITHKLSFPLQRPYRNSRFWMRARPATLVEVRTDNELVGWGEGGVPSEEAIDHHVIGANPFNYELIYDALSDNGREGNTACAIEIALWDLMGKALDKPVYQLLGGARRKRVPAYASGFFQREGLDHFQDLAEEARRCRDLGFGALKARIGFGPDYDPEILGAMRNGAGEDVGLAADANQGYDDVDTAIEAGKRLADLDPLWYEEPIHRDDLDGYCRLREALPMRISGAEGRVGVRSFQAVVERQAMDILQPDISIAGGFTECRRVWSLAWANRIPILPHYFGAVVRLAATLQWMAAIPVDEEAEEKLPLYLELDVMENGLRTELSRIPFELEDGMMPIPDRPGLGVEIDEAALQKYATTD